MKKVSTIEAALLGSSSALGINWMYDRPFLDNYLKDKNPIFLPIDHEAYKNSKNGFDVYPNHQIGDLDFMGEVIYILHKHLKEVEDSRTVVFRDTLYDYLKPNGRYDGYIEAYGKALIEKVTDERQKDLNPEVHTVFEDKQLIGPAMLLAVFDNPKSVNKVADSLNYAKVLTSYSGVNYFNRLLENLLSDFENGKDKLEALEFNIKYAPKQYQNLLQESLKATDMNQFINDYSGIACGLEQAFPLIYYIVANTNSWEEALKLNASLGGASSARGIFVSALFNLLDDIPDEYANKLNYKL